MRPALLAVIGRKGCGKSGVIEKLILNLRQRGFRIGLVKHLAKPGLEIDQPEKDTYRYRKCGAETVVLSGQNQMAIFSDIREETPLKKILLFFENYDLVLLEGYFLDAVMKIEVHRSEAGDPLTQKMANVLALVSDVQTPISAVHFTHDQTAGLIYLVEGWMKIHMEMNLQKEEIHA